MAWQSDYVTVPELAAYVRIDDTVDDAQLSLAISAASRAVDRHTNRQFGLVAVPEVRRYTAQWDRTRSRWVVDVDDFQTLTGLVVTASAGTVDVFATQPVNAAQKDRPWTRLVVDPTSAAFPNGDENEVSVTAQWGWTAVPVAVKQATALQASRLLKRRDAPFGVAGSPELGSELRLLAKVDVDVAVVLGPYVRWWAAV